MSDNTSEKPTEWTIDDYGDITFFIRKKGTIKLYKLEKAIYSLKYPNDSDFNECGIISAIYQKGNAYALQYEWKNAQDKMTRSLILHDQSRGGKPIYLILSDEQLQQLKNVTGIRRIESQGAAAGSAGESKSQLRL